MERGKTEKDTQTLKANHKREVWDCESSLYDSFELKSFERQLDSAISSTRSMSMPHLSSSSLRHHLPPPPLFDHKPTSKKPFKLTRSINKLIRSVFRPRHNHHNTSSRDGAFYVYDTSTALSTIPEAPEFDRLSPDMKFLVTRTGSDRFMPAASLGISCA